MVSRIDSGAPDSPRLQVAMRHRIGSLAIDAAFSLSQPWTVLFGPSGSGKSTILRAIAGLVRPDSGKIAWRSAAASTSSGDLVFTVFDSSSNRATQTHRCLAPLAPQAACLFPHMTVTQNVGYRFRRQTETSRAEVDAALSLFCIAHLATKRPAELSGGEAQRVNLARAVVGAERGGILLLDEPFTGLDFALRAELIASLQAYAMQRNLCVLSVTHDVAEAFQLGAQVIKIAEGRVVSQGPVEDVLAAERAQLLDQLGSGGERFPSSEPFLSG